MRKSWLRVMVVGATLALLLVAPAAQEQNVPDAPSAVKPPSPFPADAPKGPPAPKSAEPEQAAPGSRPEDNVNTPPPQAIRNVPAGGATPGERSSRDDMYTIIVTPSQVIVPVTVRDSGGRLVEGLSLRDFSVYEDGTRQSINFFTSDPFPLSVALVIDTGMPDVTMRKVNETLPNVAGAFSPYDEVSLYMYANNVERVLDWNAAGDKLTAAIKRSRRPGRVGGGVPMVGGPMSAGPTVNGRPFDPNTPQVQTARRESRVLNDAILQAAQDLARRDRARRKIIFLVSDGREDGSRAGYQDVLKVLLSNEITVYAVAVGDAAIPLYDRAAKIHVPGTGYGNLLPRYASATGGQMFAEFTKDAIESTYARVTEVARNQYTLGYTTKATAASNYRSIEVRVHRGGLRVFAKDGYYPLPPPKPQAQ